MTSPIQWRATELGGGAVRQTADEISLTLMPGPSSVYHDAQISDYRATVRDFANEPPLRLELRARAHGEIGGTAGFGFWNHAFAPGEARIPPAASAVVFLRRTGERNLPGERRGWQWLESGDI